MEEWKNGGVAMRMTVGALALSGLIAIPLTMLAAHEPSEAGAQFRFEAVSDRSLGLWESDRPVFVYNHGPIGKPGLEGARERSSYVHPIYGLDGEILTDDFPKDHVYHRGLYWAWPHMKIGEEEYDSWILRGIRHEFQRWIERDAGPNHALLAVENGWFVGERKVMGEEVRFEVHPADTLGRAIDVGLTWTPIDRDITLRGAEDKSYGGLTLRFGPRTKTAITLPEGLSKDDRLMTRLPWADLSGDLAGGNKMSGIAVFVHPQNDGFPPEWMTRHYGLLAVGWPGISAKTLPAGKPVRHRFRLWIHRGNPDAASIRKQHEAYTKAGTSLL